MSDATKLTIALLRESLTGDAADIGTPSDETLAEVCLLAKRHDLAHLCDAVLQKHAVALPKKLEQVFRSESTLAIYRYTRLWQTYEKIAELFEDEGIDYLPLKGAYLRYAYPKPEMRTSCDVDILVKKESLSRAVTLLCDKMGFAKNGETFHDVSLTLGEGIHLELHHNITENDDRIDPVLGEVWENATAEEGTHRYRMTRAFFAFHVISHMYSHFTRGGCGIRALMDLWVLRHRADFDEEGTRALCERCSLTAFYDGITKLSEIWFSGEKHDEITALVEDFILRGGVYGTRGNRVTAGAGRRQSRLRYAFSRIFLPKRFLELSYPYLKDHPILLPFYQVRRWVRILLRGKSKAALGELAYAATLPKETQQATEVMFSKLGL